MTPRSSSALGVWPDRPEVHRRLARDDLPAALLHDRDQHVALGAIARACLLDVAFVVPRHDRRTLDELLRRRSDRRAVRLQRRDDLRRRGDEARAIAGHRRALAERVERDDARAIRDLEGRGRRLVEPELRVRLVRRDDEVVPLGRLRELLVERERCDGPGRVVRVVDPHERYVVVELIEIRKKALVAAQWQCPHCCAREHSPALVDRICRLTERDDLPADVEHLGEGEDRLLRAVGRDNLGVRVDGDAEAAIKPARGGSAQLRQPLCERIRRALGQRVDERLPDHRIGRLVRIALPEVDHVDAGREQAPLLLLEPHEGVRRHLGQDRVDRHERNLASVSYAVCRFATGICSSTLCAYAVAPGP